MRRASVLLSLSAAYIACGTSSNPPDKIETADASFDATLTPDASPTPDGSAAETAGACGNDMECGDKEYCSANGGCTALPTPGAVACAGGGNVTSACNMSATAAALATCAGLAAASACPYCRDSSCYWPMSWKGPACTTDADCHKSDRCSSGLCIVDSSAGVDPCPTTVSIPDIIAGRYGAGKEVCIKDIVAKVVNETDGDFHVRMGNLSYPGQTFVGFVTEPTPQNVGQGKVTLPAQGATVRVHGMVRWDEGHKWWELHPVDWIGP